VSITLPTLGKVAPGQPLPLDGAPAPVAAPEPTFYVLTGAAVLGPITSAELADVAEVTFALTGATVTVTKA